MKILIITTYFPPDTAIAAVRPFMFAKYLIELTHDITVIRSGKIGRYIDNMTLDIAKLNVLSYNSDVLLLNELENKNINNAHKIRRSRIGFLPLCLRKPLSKIYNYLNSPFRAISKIRTAKKNFALQKELIDKLKKEGRTFDVIFSTYGELENVYAGEYAAKVFDCKWNLDFRDAIAQRRAGIITYLINLNVQKKAILSADLCTAVSQDLSEDLNHYTKDKKIATLYNGFDEIDFDINYINDKNTLSFCYTGKLYSGNGDASFLFETLRRLSDKRKINLNNIIFYYAGDCFEKLVLQAKKHNVEKILVNCGYLGREDTLRLQLQSDIFVVLTWNTKKDRGILTGKLYEALRARKPIIALVSGNQPNSEIKRLIETNKWGICCEKANSKQDILNLKYYIMQQYEKKMSGVGIISEALDCSIDKFNYKNLTRELDTILTSLVVKDKLI